MQKDFLDFNFDEAAIDKNNIFTKLPQISRTHKNPNFKNIIEKK